jgi:hypothetical protein
MLNNVLWFYGQGQSAELKSISIWEYCTEYAAAPHLYWQTLLL